MPLSVLLVDDDPVIRALARLALARVGAMTVRIASSGDEALARCAEELPDVVLLDVMMPGRDGPATLAALRADPATRAVPVIFLTAATDAAEVERWVGLGAVGVVPKPFDPMTLATRVRAILDAAGA